VKKRLALVLAGAAAMGGLSIVAANANALVNTPVGNANVDPASHDTVVLDGNSDNPDPLDGYLIVHADTMSISCSDQGGPYNNDGSEDESWNQGVGNDDPGTCNPPAPPAP